MPGCRAKEKREGDVSHFYGNFTITREFDNKLLSNSRVYITIYDYRYLVIHLKNQPKYCEIYIAAQGERRKEFALLT